MEPDRVAALARAAAAESVPAKAPDTARDTAAAREAGPTGVAAEFPGPNPSILRILNTRKKPAKPSSRVPACSGWWSARMARLATSESHEHWAWAWTKRPSKR